MATIHPRPKLAYFRDDGDGGLDLVITTLDGGTFVWPVKDADAARYLAQLSSHVERRFRKQERAA